MALEGVDTIVGGPGDDYFPCLKTYARRRESQLVDG